ncbi:hypothetical protein KFL_002980090 [Klebsormidium nitens]|uniref:Cytochrome b561 and DOMON domain-containing protein n=1 Tax=Klebsormidium nitens TaxID=105231 RepID=A0A1Y1ID04_KLENI|nr:hypothetical protein KFL_002980090 [Klebsormidium nitens]|eukprot:GAQ86586.1 hypothetical protein KFL_002980090 [Klebsormidium nitens]
MGPFTAKRSSAFLAPVRLALLLVSLVLLSPFAAGAPQPFDRLGAGSRREIIAANSFLSSNSGGRRLFQTSSTSSGCTITFQGASVTFQVCIADSSGFTFRWNDQGSNVVQISVSDQSGGWIGFGIGARMVGSSAAIAFPASGGNSAGGVYANTYYLGGERSSEVNPGGNLQLSTDGVEAEYTGGVMTMLFTLTLASGQYPTSSVIFARGVAGNPSTGAIPEHTQYYQGRLTWQVATTAPTTAPTTVSGSGNSSTSSTSAPTTNSGSGSSGPGLTIESGQTTMTKVHGIIQMIVWSVIFPLGIIAARFFHHMDPLWWHLHRAIQGLGFIGFAVGLGLGLKSKAAQSGASGVHTILAIVLLVAISLQILAVVLRPKKDAKVRSAWNLYHHWLGRSAIVIAIVNIYIGLNLYNASSEITTAYTVIWVAVALVYLALEAYWRIRGPWSKGYASKQALPTSVPSGGSVSAVNGPAMPRGPEPSAPAIVRPSYPPARKDAAY